MAGDVRAGRAFVEAYWKDSRLRRGLDATSARLKAWGTSITGLGTKIAAFGAAAGAGLLVSAKTFASMGDQLDKMSGRVGASVEFLSALGHAAKLGGSDLDSMEVAIRRLQRAAYDSTQGLKTAKDAFAQLGVSATNTDGSLKGTEQLFMESVTALSSLTNETQKAALATVLLGRSGTSILPMLSNGREGMIAAMREAKRLGLVMSREDATAAAKLEDAMMTLGSSLKMVVARIGGALAPVITELSGRVSRFLAPIIAWVKANGQLVVSVAKLVLVTFSLGAGIIALGLSLKIVGVALAGLSSVVWLAVSAFGAMASAVVFLVSPIGLVVTALGGFVAYLLYTTNVGRQALDWLGERFAELGVFVRKVFAGIADAMVAGDMALAAKVLWLGLRVLWQEGIAALLGYWSAFKAVFLQTWTEAVYGLAMIWTDAVATVRQVWNALVTGLHVAWLKFVAGFVSAWKTAEKSVATGIAYIIAKAQGLDPKEVQKALSDQYKRESRSRQEQLDLDTGAVDKERGKSQRSIEADRKARQDALAAMMDEEQRARKKANDAATSGTRAELEAAKKELDDALREAAKKRAAMGKGGEFNPEQFGGQVQSGLATANNAAKSLGTFSAFSAARLGGTADDAIRKNTEETAKNGKALLNWVKAHPGGVFT